MYNGGFEEQTSHLTCQLSALLHSGQDSAILLQSGSNRVPTAGGRIHAGGRLVGTATRSEHSFLGSSDVQASFGVTTFQDVMLSLPISNRYSQFTANGTPSRTCAPGGPHRGSLGGAAEGVIGALQGDGCAQSSGLVALKGFL